MFAQGHDRFFSRCKSRTRWLVVLGQGRKSLSAHVRSPLIRS
jgi:hypothetical protein